MLTRRGFVPQAGRVLVIAYIFPPLGGSGVQRTVKFARYLPEFGWEPLVVCGDTPAYASGSLDPSLLRDVPKGTRVVRRPFRSARGMRGWLKRRLPIGRTASAEQPAAGGEPAGEGQGPAEARRGRRAMLRRVLGALSYPLRPIEFPPVDAELYWALSIVPLCRRIIREQKVDVIYTTSFPYSDHVAGLILKRLTGKPWVADFRDPWSLNASARQAGWRRWIDVSAERRVLSRADRVVAVTPDYTDDFRRLAPRRDPSHFVTITNGYDEADFAAHDPLPLPWEGDGKVTLAHVGFVFPGTAIPFLSALAQLGDAARRLRVVFVGGLGEPDAQWLREHPVPVEVRRTPRVPHAQAIEAMRAADAVLMLIGLGPEWLGHYPGKLFEYMRCGTPIFLSGPDGAAARLVRESGVGCAAAAEDVEATAQEIRALAVDPGAFRGRHYHPDMALIARHERRELTRQLATVLDDVTRARQ